MTQNENLPISDSGAVEDVQDTNLSQGGEPDNTPVDTVGGEEPTQEDEQKSYEQLEEERKRAVTEAISNHKQAKEARVESDYLKSENKVLRNPESIMELHKEDPTTADEIARNLWGVSYDQLIEYANQQNAQKQPAQQPVGLSREDIRREVQSELARHNEVSERQKIDNLEIDFFTKKNITPDSALFKNVLSTYKSFNPTTYNQAQELLDMAYAKHTNRGTSEAGDIDSVPSLSGGRANTPNKGLKMTPGLKQVAHKLGLSPADLKKFGNK